MEDKNMMFGQINEKNITNFSMIKCKISTKKALKAICKEKNYKMYRFVDFLIKDYITRLKLDIKISEEKLNNIPIEILNKIEVNDFENVDTNKGFENVDTKGFENVDTNFENPRNLWIKKNNK